jgi:hypothetical protein
VGTQSGTSSVRRSAPRRLAACGAVVVVAAVLGVGEAGAPFAGGGVEKQRPASESVRGAGPQADASGSGGATGRGPRTRREGGTIVARVRHGRAVSLRERPGGGRRARLGSRTEFGSPRTLPALERRGPWLGVATTARPDGRLAWIDGRRVEVELSRTSYSLRADLSRRELELRRGDRVVERLTVGIGRPGSPTPPGRFAVTDKLRGHTLNPSYGCCVLALSGRQPNPPPGWSGGDRLAIHGTADARKVGAASSAGCLSARDAELRELMRRVPLGTPVSIDR